MASQQPATALPLPCNSPSPSFCSGRRLSSLDTHLLSQADLPDAHSARAFSALHAHAAPGVAAPCHAGGPQSSCWAMLARLDYNGHMRERLYFL
eukprot:6211465-Pleurochrysis_carterae.AAC.5